MVKCPMFLSLRELGPDQSKDPRRPELRLFLSNLVIHRLIPQFKNQGVFVSTIEKELVRFSDMGEFAVHVVNQDGANVQIEFSITPVIVVVELHRRVLH